MSDARELLGWVVLRRDSNGNCVSDWDGEVHRQQTSAYPALEQANIECPNPSGDGSPWILGVVMAVPLNPEAGGSE